jgi:hypothetical protein
MIHRGKVKTEWTGGLVIKVIQEIKKIIFVNDRWKSRCKADDRLTVRAVFCR